MISNSLADLVAEQASSGVGSTLQGWSSLLDSVVSGGIDLTVLAALPIAIPDPNSLITYDASGNIQFFQSLLDSGSNPLFDGSVSPVQLNYPGRGSSYPLADGSGNLYSSAIYPALSTPIWANPSTRIIYDQYNEPAFSTVSDSWNTDSQTTLISDPDYGYVAVNGSLIVRQGIQMQSFGASTTIQLNNDGSASFGGGGQTQLNNDGSASFANEYFLIASTGYTTIGGNCDVNGNFDCIGSGNFNGGLTSPDGSVTVGPYGECSVNTDGSASFGNFAIDNSGNLTTPGSASFAGGAFSIDASGLIYPVQAPTSSAPTYAKGAVYFDTTLNKLRVGGAAAWETITSV